MDETALIDEILNEASVYVRRQYAQRNELNVSTKEGPNDLLTEADLETQRIIVTRIKERYPDDVVVAEEAGLNVLPKDPNTRCWFVDPIDGTQNFVRGMFPMFGISVAYTDRGQALSGAVDFPLIETRISAEWGAGAYENGQRTSVAETERLETARLEVEFSILEHRRESMDRFADLIQRTGQLRCFGSAVVGMCSVATGGLDGYIHIHMNQWDIAAAVLIIEEAGGRVTRLDGGPVSLFAPAAGVVATNSFIHDECLGAIRTARHADNP